MHAAHAQQERAKVEAYLPGSSQRKTGFSGQRSETEAALLKAAPSFHRELRNLPNRLKKRRDSVFDCAEPNAVANLILRNPNRLADIRIDFTTYSGGHEILPLCDNCQQWLEEDGVGTRVYRIKAQFLPRPPAPPTPNIQSRDEFPYRPWEL